MTDTDRAKEALAGLATGEFATPDGSDSAPTDPRARRPGDCQSDDYRAVVERAVAATDDLSAAAEFVETVGLDELERAVRGAEREVSGVAADGRRALEAFERYREAAAAEGD